MDIGRTTTTTAQLSGTLQLILAVDAKDLGLRGPRIIAAQSSA